MFKVMDRECDQCLFGPDKVVSDARRAELLRKCAANQRYFICHKASAEGADICCAGFYENMGHRSQMVRIAERLGVVERVDTTEWERRFRGEAE